MKKICAIVLGMALTSPPIMASDLPSNHELWPPKVFASAYKLIATDDERNALDTLTGVPRTEFLARFWKRRDPTPSTPANDFMEQFRERVETALIWFKTVNIRDPWDARGTVYIKIGEPDLRQDSVDFWYSPMDTVKLGRAYPMMEKPTITQRGDPNWFKRDYGEVWYYFGRNLILQFQGYDLDYQLVPFVNARGDYQPLFDFEERVYEVDTAQTAYVPPLGREELTLALEWYPFRREDGQYDVYFGSAFPVSAIAEVSGYRQYSLSYSASVSVHDDQMSPVWSDRVSTMKQFEGSTRGLSIQNGFSHVLPPGYYLVGGEVTSADSVVHASATLEGWLVPYAEQVELDLSALVIAATISDAPQGGTSFVRNGKQIIPVPGGVFAKDQPIYFYHEVYNLALVADGMCTYRIRYTLYDQKRKRERLLTDRTLESSETQSFHSGSIPPGTLRKGQYILEAKIDDLVSGQTKVALAGFEID